MLPKNFSLLNQMHHAANSIYVILSGLAKIAVENGYLKWQKANDCDFNTSLTIVDVFLEVAVVIWLVLEDFSFHLKGKISIALSNLRKSSNLN